MPVSIRYIPRVLGATIVQKTAIVDIATRLRLLAVAPRDISSRMRLLAVKTADIALRTRLQAVTSRDLSLRVIVILPPTVRTRDLAARLNLYDNSATFSILITRDGSGTLVTR